MTTSRDTPGVTRRTFLGGVTAVAAAVGTPALAATPPASAATAGVVPLPSPSQIRADIQRMVDVGPRLTGYDAHLEFCDWLRGEFVAAGLHLEQCDQYTYQSWHPSKVTLEIVEGPDAGAIEIAFPYVRSATTPRDGVTARLFDAGTMPVPGLVESVSGADAEAMARTWARALPAAEVKDSIIVVNLDIPERLTASIFVGISSYLHWTGHTAEDWAKIDYRRPWATTWPLLGVFKDLGVQGVVFVVDAPLGELRGNYSPHTGHPQPVPAVMVDREAGKSLRRQAGARRMARLTLDAPSHPTQVQTVTAVVPGESDEIIVISSHSDGQNAFEENGSVALVALARHFASLEPTQRLRRTLMFVSYPGHMSGIAGMQDASGWIVAHPDLVKRAVAAVSIEHLGATEWAVTPENGYHATGENELYAIWTTQGPTQELATAALIEADLQRHALLKPPIQITPGAPFHDAGVPHVSGIAGPTYLLVVSDNGEMDKLDEHLAAKQIGFYADVIKRLDRASAAQLRTGDPTLGAKPPTIENLSTPVGCAPAAAGTGHDTARRSTSHHDDGQLPVIAGGAAVLAAGGVAALLRLRNRGGTDDEPAEPPPL